MKTSTAWLVYSLLRLLFFVIPFVALQLIGWPWWLNLIIAALVSLSLSVIFLAKPRETASQSIYDWRTRERTTDDIAEDAELGEQTDTERTGHHQVTSEGETDTK